MMQKLNFEEPAPVKSCQVVTFILLPEVFKERSYHHRLVKSNRYYAYIF